MSPPDYINPEDFIRLEKKIDTLLELVAELKVQKRGPRKSPEYSGDFLHWWAAYPKKIDKKGCGRIWNSRKLHMVTSKPTGGSLTSDVQYRMKHDSQWIGGYAPYPKTYLNGNRWLDDIMPIKLQLPSDDKKLVSWAETNGYPGPTSTEKYKAYRQRLGHLMRGQE